MICFPRSRNFCTRYFSAAIFLCVLCSPPSYSEPKDDVETLLDMSLDQLMNIRTGRVGSGMRSKVDTSYSVTTIDENALRLQAPTSVVDAVKSVPGFWVEDSGGDASENIRARGIPNDGFQSINLLEDGIPVQHDPYPNTLTADQSFRLDETIDHIEVVRGGPSSTFYSFAPAGVINFIPRKVGDTETGLIKYTVGSFGLNRADFWYGKPLDDGWKASAGGFYRQADGVRDPGYVAYKGGQVRMTLSKDLQDGHMSFDIKHMNDTVPFYVDDPMQRNADGSISAVRGFDANNGNYVGPQFQNIALRRYDGSIYHFDSADGTSVERDQFTFKIDHGLTNGWRFSDAFRISKEQSNRNDVTPLAVYSTADFLAGQAANAAKYGAGNLQLVYANSMLPFNSVNGLMMVAQAGSHASALQEASNDLQLHRSFIIAGQTHDVTIGYTFASYHQNTNEITGAVLMGAQNQAPLLGLVGTNGSGGQITLTDPNGVFQQGYSYSNDSATVTSNALYVSDEWQIDRKWRVDGGMRWEREVTNGTSPITQVANLGTFTTGKFVEPSGQSVNFNSPFSHMGWTLGANYQLAANSGLFARITPTYRLPGLYNYIPNESTRTQITQTMTLGELGYKYADRYLQFYPTLFFTTYDNVSFHNQVYSETGSTITQQSYANTKTEGLELEGKFTPMALFDVSYNATWQNARYENYAFTSTVANSTSALITTDYSGNQLIRIPKFSFRMVPGINLMGDKLRLQLSFEYEGARYVDAANSVVLPAYTVVNFAACYAITQKTQLYFYVDNVNNSEGLTEGNPRAGEIQSTDAGANTFLARTILGRSFRLALKHDF